MGARSSQSRGPGLNKTDGHLIEYFRNAFSAGGGANSGPTAGTVKATGGTRSDYGANTIHQLKASGSLVFPADFDKDIFYVVVGGGGGGGADIGGGGGAGAWRQGSLSVTGPVTFPVNIGAGGAGGPYPSNDGSVGGDTTFTIPTGTPIVSPGGGKGSRGASGGEGGSGGGGRTGSAANGTGDPYPGDNTASSPSNGWGNNGGGGHPDAAGTGGGGAGSTGANGTPGKNTGKGGDGIQLRPEFHNSSHP